MPSRYRTIRPSASRLRCIRKISPLWRFSNLRKLSTIQSPFVAYALPKQPSYESYLAGPPTRSKPFAEVILQLLSWFMGNAEIEDYFRIADDSSRGMRLRVS